MLIWIDASTNYKQNISERHQGVVDACGGLLGRKRRIHYTLMLHLDSLEY